MWQWWILHLQVPEGLVDESGILLNKGNIHNAKTSPHSVLTGVHKSFERNFTLFLRSRSQEMVSGGHMVLTIIGSDRKADSSGNQSCTIWELTRNHIKLHGPRDAEPTLPPLSPCRNTWYASFIHVLSPCPSRLKMAWCVWLCQPYNIFCL